MPISRRDFVLRAGQVGGALFVSGSPLADRCLGLIHDSFGRAPADVDALRSGLRWRMLGPFRGGRVAAATGVPGRPHEFYFGAVNGGVWKSIDAGRVWTPVFDSQPVASIGAIAVAPSAPDVVYVGSGESTLRDSVGYGNGIYKSTDGGNTWKQLIKGLPQEGIGRTGIAVAPSNPRRVYAVVDCLVPEVQTGTPPAQPQLAAPVRPGRPPAGAAPMQGGFFRSDDAGATWTRLSNDLALWGRGWYFEKVTVDPKNADVVYVPNVAVNRSKDGGKTWVVLRGSPGGDDYHQAWINPVDTNVMIVASDQGAVITHNAKDDPRNVTWSSWLNQPTAQLYHLSVDYRFPYWVTAAQQDSGAVAVRSRGKFAEISTHDWQPIAPGGESGYTAGDL